MNQKMWSSNTRFNLEEYMGLGWMVKIGKKKKRGEGWLVYSKGKDET